jgi:hypothetical protein
VTALAAIGALFLALSAWFAGVPYLQSILRGKPIEFEKLLPKIGIGGAIVWFVIGFGFASWLVTLPFRWLGP